MMESKDSNPKEAMGSAKLDFSVVPCTAIAHLASAMGEGGFKYGPHNYREAGVRASTYYSAGMRHWQKWWEGQDCDPKTRVHHLANTMACAAILLDAEFMGMLNDDRPIKADLEALHEKLAGVQAHLRDMFKDKNPPRYTHQRKMEKAMRDGAVSADKVAPKIIGVINDWPSGYAAGGYDFKSIP